MSVPADRLSKTSLPGSRYELLVKIAIGATATVYVGRLTGTVGFSRLVAIKRAHPHVVDDPTGRRMLIAEALLASKVHHAHVVAVHDIEDVDGELLLVMDYVEGASLAELLQRSHDRLPPRIAMRIALDCCSGLHAIHELVDDDGKSLGLVHRDVSPQNVLVGIDGTARVADLGLAKLTEATQSRSSGIAYGKLGYMAPEYVRRRPFDVACDVFALGVVVWEALTGARLFRGNGEFDTLRRILDDEAPPPSSVAPWLPTELDSIVCRALEKDPRRRYGSALELANDLGRAAARLDLAASGHEVGAHVKTVVGDLLAQRRVLIRDSASRGGPPVKDGGAADARAERTIPIARPDGDAPQSER